MTTIDRAQNWCESLKEVLSDPERQKRLYLQGDVSDDVDEMRVRIFTHKEYQLDWNEDNSAAKQMKEICQKFSLRSIIQYSKDILAANLKKKIEAYLDNLKLCLSQNLEQSDSVCDPELIRKTIYGLERRAYLERNEIILSLEEMHQRSQDKHNWKKIRSISDLIGFIWSQVFNPKRWLENPENSIERPLGCKIASDILKVQIEDHMRNLNKNLIELRKLCTLRKFPTITEWETLEPMTGQEYAEPTKVSEFFASHFISQVFSVLNLKMNNDVGLQQEIRRDLLRINELLPFWCAIDFLCKEAQEQTKG